MRTLIRVADVALLVVGVRKAFPVWLRILPLLASAPAVTSGLLDCPVALSQGPQTADRSRTIIDAVSKLDDAKELLAELSSQAVPQALQAIDKLSTLDESEKESLKKQVLAYKDLIDPQLVRLKRYDSVFEANDTLEKFVDFYGEYKEMKETASVLTYKPQQDLAKLATILKNHGADVPLIGKALEVYGEITLKFVDALEALGQAIVERMGGNVGSGSPLEYPPNAALQRQFENIWKNDTYAPQGPDFVYRPLQDVQPVLIWDKAAATWYVVRSEASGWGEVEAIYRDSLQYMDLRLTGEQLHRLTLAPTFEDIQQRRNVGKDVRDYLARDWFPDPDLEVIIAVNTAADQAEPLPIYDQRQFQASYALDYRFRARVARRLKLNFDGYWRKDRPKLASDLRSLAIVRWKLDEAKTWWCDGQVRWAPPNPREVFLHPASGGQDRIRCEYMPVTTQEKQAGIVTLGALKAVEFSTYNLMELKVAAQIKEVVLKPGSDAAGRDGELQVRVVASATGKRRQGTQVVPFSLQGDAEYVFSFSGYKGLEVLSEFKADERPSVWNWSGGKQNVVETARPPEAVVELAGLSREIPVALAAGGRLLLKRSVAGGNPYVAALGEVDQARLSFVGERSERAESTGRLGAPEEMRVYELRAKNNAEGSARVVVELRRPWEKSASIRYTIVVDFGKK